MFYYVMAGGYRVRRVELKKLFLLVKNLDKYVYIYFSIKNNTLE